ncbi:MAG: hypothetical protein ACOC95_08715 [Planctomycetota bacterium]
MKKPVKIIGGIAGGLLVVLVLVVAVVWIYLDTIAARAIVTSIETTGEVPASVDDVSLSVFRGRMGIDDLVLGNPRGFPEATMFRVDRAEVDVELGSLFGDPIHVETLEVRAPFVRVDAGLKGTNVQAFLANIREKAGAPPERREAPPTEPTRLIVDHLLIRDAQVSLGAGFTRAEVTATLPTVELTDIRGEKGRGVTPAQLAAVIVVELVKQGAGKLDVNLGDLIPADLVEGIQAIREVGREALEAGEDVLERGREALEKGEGTLEDLEGAGEQIERKGREAAEDVRKRIEGILDGGRDGAPGDDPRR